MRRKLALTLVLGSTLTICLVAISPATNYPSVCLRRPSPALAPTIGCPPRLELKASVGFAPKKLPKKELAPIAVNIGFRVHYDDGKQPPALEKMTMDFDRNGRLAVTEIPVCGKATLETRGARAARRACRGSIVGAGVAHIAIRPSEQRPISLPLTLFNGGVKGGTTTLFVQSSIAVPIPTPIVATVKLKEINKGRYGMQAISTIPQMADGSGSVLDFNFTIERLVESKGGRQPYATARCFDGRQYARLTSTFADGTVLVGTVVQACTAEG
jgi:hypothetical protein